MKRLQIFISVLLLGIVLCVIGCGKESIKNTASDLAENGVERVFKFEECKKLYDGNFYVTYCVQSDIKSEVDEKFLLNPKIKVSTYKIGEFMNKSDYSLPSNIEDDLSDDLIEESEYDVSEVIKNGNIPSGHKVELFYNNLSNIETRASGSYRNRYFTDSGAVGIFVGTSPSHTVPTHFYGKGCCWYSSGWYHRGNYTMSINNTNTHSFNSMPTWSPYHGAKIRAYTTVSAWNAMTKIFLY